MKIFPTWLKILIVIVERIIHASAIFMIMLIVYSIKTNPDWRITNTRHYNYKMDYTVNSDLYNLKNLSNEIIPIVTKYQKNPRLVEIAYHFKGKSNRYIKKAYLITVEIDIYNKKITEILKTTGEDVNDERLSNAELIKPLEKDLASMLNNYSDKDSTLEINNFGIWIYNYVPNVANQHISFD